MGLPDVWLATCRELPKGDPDTALLARRLRKGGIEATVAVWDDPSVDWAGAPLTVIRSTWDYHLRREDFLEWAASVPGLQNPIGLVEWNTDKTYIFGLSAGVPVIPSRILVDPTGREVESCLQEAGWEVAVLKPAVGLDGHGVEKVLPGQVPRRTWEGRWLLQAFAPDVAERGEVSVVLIAGQPTHAVRRLPPPGDFRAQERLGGRVGKEELTPSYGIAAERAVADLDEAPLYARVDLVEFEGSPTLMELELVEPSLFFEFGPDGLSAMVEAIADRLSG